LPEIRTARSVCSLAKNGASELGSLSESGGHCFRRGGEGVRVGGWRSWFGVRRLRFHVRNKTLLAALVIWEARPPCRPTYCFCLGYAGKKALRTSTPVLALSNSVCDTNPSHVVSGSLFQRPA